MTRTMPSQPKSWSASLAPLADPSQGWRLLTEKVELSIQQMCIENIPFSPCQGQKKIYLKVKNVFVQHELRIPFSKGFFSRCLLNHLWTSSAPGAGKGLFRPRMHPTPISKDFLEKEHPLLRQGRPTGIRITGSASSTPGAGVC